MIPGPLVRNKCCLFHGSIFLTNKTFLLSYFPNFHCQHSGGNKNFTISYLKQSCFSHRGGSVKHRAFHEQENIEKTPKSLMKTGRNDWMKIWPPWRKTEPVGKSYKYVGKEIIDLGYVCQQLADGCKLCKTEVSLAHYEDETVIGLDSILHRTYIHHNFTVWYDTSCFVQ